MFKLFGGYFAQWWKIMVRPIYFYTFMEKGEWSDKSLSFLLFTSWILSFFITFVFFYTQIVNIIMYRFVEGITGLKFLLLMPVLFVFAVIFFVFFYLISGGLIAILFAAGFGAAAAVLNLIARIFGLAADMREMVKAAYYSSAASLFYLLIFVLGFAVKIKVLSSDNFLIGINLLMFLTSVYMWGLWSISFRKVYKVSKMKAVCATFIVFLLVVLLEMFVGTKFLPRIERILF